MSIGANFNPVSADVPSQAIVDAFVGVCHGRLEQVKTMLGEHPGLINAASSQNETGIQAAAHTGQKEICRFLLAEGAPLDICTAAVLGMAAEVERMLAADASRKDATGAHGLPVMLFAALGGSLDIARTLRASGAPVNGGDGVSTPLHGTVWADQPEIADWLIANGAKTDSKDFNGKTPKQAAEAIKRPRVLEVFERHNIA